MNLPDSDDAIVAISTPPGVGGIGVIRISGKQAFTIAARLVREPLDISQVDSHTLHFCHIAGGSGELLDEVVLSIFKSPRSYTGEDVVEISAHGNPLLLRRIVELAIDFGARQAQPGEFTLRAFESGRIDLVQAEAVADLVAAAGEAAQRNAYYQLSGKLSEYLNNVRADLLEITTLFTAYTDFPEEDIPPTEKADIRRRIVSAQEKLSRLAGSYRRGRLLKDGFQIPIIGPPNAGKSSLFNAILAEERSIVTEIPGTTRDTIAESVELAGVSVRFSDTAGLRESQDLIESKGIEHSQREIAGATLLLALFDVTNQVGDKQELGQMEVAAALEQFAEHELILVFNKIDLLSESELEEVQELYAAKEAHFVSARQLLGIDEMLAALAKEISESLLPGSDLNVLTNERHFRACNHAAEILAEVRSRLAENVSYEFLAFDLRQTVELLEELLGKISSEETLAEIFSRFCIGK
ncbi:MAG: tRNA uridine-5-carboxymethylaminomethyl(34) synthesis GTPase MnmE [bacterium]